MKHDKQEIIKRFLNYVKVMTESKKTEKDLKTIGSYNRHIDVANDLIKQLQFDSKDFDIRIATFYEIERRQFGWDYLPNENGEIAELEFWRLMKDLELFEEEISNA